MGGLEHTIHELESVVVLVVIVDGVDDGCRGLSVHGAVFFRCMQKTFVPYAGTFYRCFSGRDGEKWYQQKMTPNKTSTGTC